MKKSCGMMAAALVLVACSPSEQQTAAMPDADLVELQRQAAMMTGQFTGTLLPTLQQAMQEGGPVNAINVCAVQAPVIAQTLSSETGWQVRRVSLKARNASLATPDAWEVSTLHEFDQRQQAGEPAAQINKAELVNGEFRYMQAQPTATLCLTCHGTDLDPAVSQALAQLYPLDAATGYVEGQIRGAISLRTEP